MASKCRQTSHQGILNSSLMRARQELKQQLRQMDPLAADLDNKLHKGRQAHRPLLRAKINPNRDLLLESLSQLSQASKELDRVIKSKPAPTRPKPLKLSRLNNGKNRSRTMSFSFHIRICSNLMQSATE